MMATLTVIFLVLCASFAASMPHFFRNIEKKSTGCSVMEVLSCIDPIYTITNETAHLICSTVYPQVTSCFDSLPASCDGMKRHFDEARQQLDDECQGGTDAGCDPAAVMHCTNGLLSMTPEDYMSPGGLARICSVIYPEFMTCVQNLPQSCVTGESMAQLQQSQNQLNLVCQNPEIFNL